MPVKQIITEANKVETYNKQYVCLWKEAIQAIAKAMGTNQMIHITDNTFEDITIRGPDNFVGSTVIKVFDGGNLTSAPLKWKVIVGTLSSSTSSAT